MGGSVNYCKSVNHPIHTQQPAGIGSIQAIFRTNQQVLLSIEGFKYLLFFAKRKRREIAFLGGCKKRGHMVKLPPRSLSCHKR